MNQHPKRGGSRPNAGRKPTGSTRAKLSVTVSHEADAKVRGDAKRQGSTVSAVIEEMIINSNLRKRFGSP